MSESQYITYFCLTNIGREGIDNDGDLEIVVASDIDNSISVLTLVGGQYVVHQPVIAFHSNNLRQANICLGDFNNDGYLDMALGYFTGGEVTIYLYNPSSPSWFDFLPSITTPSSYAITSGDFDGDGSMDLAVVSGDGVTAHLNLLRNDGTGRFTSSTPAIDINPNWTVFNNAKFKALSAGDWDGDGLIDLIALGRSEGGYIQETDCPTGVTPGTRDYGYLFIMKNKGGGGFIIDKVVDPPHTREAILENPQSIALGDIMKDGQIDAVVANTQSGNCWKHGVAVIDHNATSTSVGSRDLWRSSGAQPEQAILGDFNGDESLEIVVGQLGKAILMPTGPDPSPANCLPQHIDDILLNIDAHMPVALDWNNDGRIDLAVTSYAPHSTSGPHPVYILTNEESDSCKKTPCDSLSVSYTFIEQTLPHLPLQLPQCCWLLNLHNNSTSIYSVNLKALSAGTTMSVNVPSGMIATQTSPTSVTLGTRNSSPFPSGETVIPKVCLVPSSNSQHRIEVNWMNSVGNVVCTDTVVFNCPCGDKCCASVCILKFDDRNADGIRSSGEEGLSGWKITLENQQTHESRTAVTDASGKVCFDCLPLGQYMITETTKQDWRRTAPTQNNYYIMRLDQCGRYGKIFEFGNTQRK